MGIQGGANSKVIQFYMYLDNRTFKATEDKNLADQFWFQSIGSGDITLKEKDSQVYLCFDSVGPYAGTENDDIECVLTGQRVLSIVSFIPPITP